MRNLPSRIRARVDAAIMRLEQNPRERGTKKLRGTSFYRIRIGDYRLLYQVDDARRRVSIHSVLDRKDAYE